ncbi:hypothetical protein AB5I41_24515 [Sphingomonas sp. MMS24-JH45]
MRLMLNGQALPLAADPLLIAFDRDAPARRRCRRRSTPARRWWRTLAIDPRAWAIQRLDSLARVPSRMRTSPPAAPPNWPVLPPRGP